MVSLVIDKDRCPSIHTLFKWSQNNAGITITGKSLESVARAREVLLKESKRRTVYGIHTRLGKLYDSKYLLDPSYEETVINEHAVGVGPLTSPQIGRLFLAIRVIQATRGFTGIRPETIERLVKPLECNAAPAIPVRGSVGASGDLAPTAHLVSQFLLGKGKVWVNGELVDAKRMLGDCGLEKWTLDRGEALLLVNTTAYSTALLGYSLELTRILFEDVIEDTLRIGEIIGANCEHWSQVVSLAKRHPGMKKVLETLSRNCKGEQRRLQDPYSSRCAPNILGAIQDGLDYIEQIVANETCSASSNPISVQEGVVHQCGFHAVYPALASDYTAILLAWIANLIERRANKLLDDNYANLPKFLAHSKSSVGGMILHYSIASLASEIRADSAPRSVHNIPTSLDHEDIVSMSPNSGLRLLRMLSLLTDELYLEKALVEIAEQVGKGGHPDIGKIYEYYKALAEDVKRKYGIPQCY
ncbi:MAG: aromatic amino acid ammonia-lyase [Desulfurococcales archaeon]|nr:aromatic amino acid ammonia-lyase [Desulfurococcales archaeon]